jgi:stage III sporulation protein AH
MMKKIIKSLLKYKRSLLVFCCILVVCFAVYADWTFGAGKLTSTNYLYNSSSTNTKILGEAAFVDNSESETQDADNYFSVCAIEREKSRDEALGTLQSIVDSADSLPDAKDAALLQMMTIAGNIEKEANIETLVRAKGFTECIALIGEDNVNVIVKTAGLLTNEVAQIKEIVMNEVGIDAQNVKIVEKF